jgi:amidase
MLLLDTHPLCPTSASVAAPLNRLGERLSGLGCRVSRRSPGLPDLVQTTRNYVELLSAFNALD